MCGKVSRWLGVEKKKAANVYLVHDVVIVLGRPEDLRSEEVAL